MVCFQTKNTNLSKFRRVLQWMMLVYFVAIWYILLVFGIFFPVLVCCTKKNLATLLTTGVNVMITIFGDIFLIKFWINALYLVFYSINCSVSSPNVQVQVFLVTKHIFVKILTLTIPTTHSSKNVLFIK
jgi:hypothetical protein